MPVRHGRQRSTMDDYARLAAYEPRMSVETTRTTQSSRSRPRSDATATAIGRLGTLLTRGEQLMQGIKTSFELDPEEVRVREDTAQRRLHSRPARGVLHSRVPAATAAAVVPRSPPLASAVRQSQPASFPPDPKDPVPYWPSHSRFTLEVAVCTAYLTSRSLLKRSKSTQPPLMKKARTSSPLPAVNNPPPFSASPTSLLPHSPAHYHHRQDGSEAHQQQEERMRPSRVPGYRGDSFDDRGRTEVSGPTGHTPWSMRRSETEVLNRPRHLEGDEEEEGEGAPTPIKRQTDPLPLSHSPASPSSSLQTSSNSPRRQLRRSGPSIRPLTVSLTMPGFSQFLQQQRQSLSPSHTKPKTEDDEGTVAPTGYQSFGPAPGQSEPWRESREEAPIVAAAGQSLRGAANPPLRGPSSSSSFTPILSTASKQPPYKVSGAEEVEAYSRHRRHPHHHPPPAAAAAAAGTAALVHPKRQDAYQPPLSADGRSTRQEEAEEEEHDPRPYSRHPLPPPPSGRHSHGRRHRRPRLDSQDRLQIRMNPTQIAKLGQMPPDFFHTRTESHLVVPALLSNYSSSAGSEAGGEEAGGSRGIGSSSPQHSSRTRRHLHRPLGVPIGVVIGDNGEEDYDDDDGEEEEEEEEELSRRRRHGYKGKGRADTSSLMRAQWDAPTASSRHSRESFSSRHLRLRQQQQQQQQQQYPQPHRYQHQHQQAAPTPVTRPGYRTAGRRRRRSSMSGSLSGSLSQSHRSMSVSSYDSMEELQQQQQQQRSAHARRNGHHHHHHRNLERGAIPHPQPLRRDQQRHVSQEPRQQDPATTTTKPAKTKKKEKEGEKEKRGHPQRFDFVAKTHLLLTPETVATLMMRRLAVEVWKVNQRTKEATDLGVAKVPLSKLIQDIMQQMQDQKLESSMSSSPTTTTHQSWGGGGGGGGTSWKQPLRRGGSSQHSIHYAHSRQSSLHHHHHHPYMHEPQGDLNTKRSQRHLHEGYGGGGGGSGGGGPKHQPSFSGSSRRGLQIPATVTTASKFGSTLNPTPFIPLEDDYQRRQRQQQQQQHQQHQQQQQHQQPQQSQRRRTLWELGPRMYRIHSRRGTVVGHLEAIVKMRPRGDSQSDISVFSRAA
ncbi:hypothetical protein DFQ26_008461 [Actinomortierella ambigua]|nr:hypothetical protein DFQ26_008461 [Actinomortierella ambigua]